MKNLKMLAVVLFCLVVSAPIFAQTGSWGNAIAHQAYAESNKEGCPPDIEKYGVYSVIDDADRDFWGDLGLALQGKYESTQKAHRKAADNKKKDVLNNLPKYFYMPTHTPNSGADAMEKALAEGNLKAKYNILNEYMGKNWVFRFYAITGKADLTSLSAEDFNAVRVFLKGEYITYKYSKQGNTVIVKISDTVSVYVYLNKHEIKIHRA